jgi:hypothetical protein
MPFWILRATSVALIRSWIAIGEVCWNSAARNFSPGTSGGRKVHFVQAIFSNRFPFPHKTLPIFRRGFKVRP